MKTLLTEGLSSQSQRTLVTAGLGLLALFEFAPGLALVVLASPTGALVVGAAGVLEVQGSGGAAGVLAAPSAGTLPPSQSAAAVVPAPGAIE